MESLADVVIDGMNINGIIINCRRLTQTILFHPTDPSDWEILMATLRQKGIDHQLDYDKETKLYTFWVWFNDKIENVTMRQYSHQDRCPIYATSVAVAKFVKYYVEE